MKPLHLTNINREASPSRYGASRGGVGSRRPPATPHLTERILRQSREAESALADALVSHIGNF